MMENILESQTPADASSQPLPGSRRAFAHVSVSLRRSTSLKSEPASCSCDYLLDAPTYGGTHHHQGHSAMQKMLRGAKKRTGFVPVTEGKGTASNSEQSRGCRKDPPGPAGPHPRHSDCIDDLFDLRTRGGFGALLAYSGFIFLRDV